MDPYCLPTSNIIIIIIILLFHNAIHLQGRNPSECSKMVEHIHKSREAAAAAAGDPNRHVVTVSIEVEKTKPELRALIPLADVVSTSVQE